MDEYDENVLRPLFGIPRPRDRVRNLVLGILTGMLVLITLIMAFLRPCIFPSLHDAVNVFFSLIILMICGSHITLIIWYREGNLEPAFRKMIYFNTATIILLCICGNLYINGVGLEYKLNCKGMVNVTVHTMLEQSSDTT